MNSYLIRGFVFFTVLSTFLFIIGRIFEANAEEQKICGLSIERLEVYKNRIKPFENVIRTTLRRFNVDEQFVWLAAIESGGKSNAESGKGASGLWQLTSNTAEHYGCKERSDIGCSTRAAAKYLSKLLTDFDGDKWSAIVGYNMGGTNYKKQRKPTSEAKHLANTVTCLMREHPYVYKETTERLEGNNNVAK